MKKLPLFAMLIAAFGIAMHVRADTPKPIAWRAYWIPWHDTYATWDWTNVQGALSTSWANGEKFPADVKDWEFAICLASDSTKTAREPLQPCLSVEENTWHLERWTPGNFPTDQLIALGDGTYLCAILANGQRISNVSRVTINHAGEPPLTPGIRISPLILFTPDIQTLAIRLIPKPDWHIHYFDLLYPYLCIDGAWTHSEIINFDGQDSVLEPGKVYGTITGFGESFIPAIKPFQQASVQVKFTQDALDHDTAPPPPIESDPAKRAKQYADAATGYLSETTPVKFDDKDIRTFDAAFGQK